MNVPHKDDHTESKHALLSQYFWDLPDDVLKSFRDKTYKELKYELENRLGSPEVNIPSENIDADFLANKKLYDFLCSLSYEETQKITSYLPTVSGTTVEIEAILAGKNSLGKHRSVEASWFYSEVTCHSLLWILGNVINQDNNDVTRDIACNVRDIEGKRVIVPEDTARDSLEYPHPTNHIEKLLLEAVKERYSSIIDLSRLHLSADRIIFTPVRYERLAKWSELASIILDMTYAKKGIYDKYWISRLSGLLEWKKSKDFDELDFVKKLSDNILSSCKDFANITPEQKDDIFNIIVMSLFQKWDDIFDRLLVKYSKSDEHKSWIFFNGKPRYIEKKKEWRRGNLFLPRSEVTEWGHSFQEMDDSIRCLSFPPTNSNTQSKVAIFAISDYWYLSYAILSLMILWDKDPVFDQFPGRDPKEIIEAYLANAYTNSLANGAKGNRNIDWRVISPMHPRDINPSAFAIIGDKIMNMLYWFGMRRKKS